MFVKRVQQSPYFFRPSLLKVPKVLRIAHGDVEKPGDNDDDQSHKFASRQSVIDTNTVAGLVALKK
jgi:hypothetical protein